MNLNNPKDLKNENTLVALNVPPFAMAALLEAAAVQARQQGLTFEGIPSCTVTFNLDSNTPPEDRRAFISALLVAGGEVVTGPEYVDLVQGALTQLDNL